MSELLKMTIYAYQDQKYEKKANPDLFVLQVNPSTIKYNKEIQQTTLGPLGGQFRAPKYAKHKEINFTFETILDATGAISTLSGGIDKQVDTLEKVVYDINGDIHRPNYLKVSWGAFIFKGILTAINYDYTLFNPEGSPLRVKVSLSLVGYMDKLQSAKRENKSSPDLSHLITLKAGENIPMLCEQIYGDASYCIEIAQYNKLVSFRNVKPGTQLMFPPLE